MRFFKKIYSDRIACGIWRDGDGVNFLPPADKRYTVEECTETEYNAIKAQTKIYYENITREKLILDLKKEKFVLTGIGEDTKKIDDQLIALGVK